MIIAVLILDKMNFALYEYFVRKDLIDPVINAIEQNNAENSEYIRIDINFLEKQFDERYRICLVYQNEEITEDVRENLPLIAQNLMKGDKVTLQQVLNAQSLMDFSYVR